MVARHSVNIVGTDNLQRISLLSAWIMGPWSIDAVIGGGGVPEIEPVKVKLAVAD